MSQSAGHVYLVGAGPGDPDLITVKGLRVLEQADAVLFDRLAPAVLLERCRPDALQICVGKAPGRPSPGQDDINQMLIELARNGRTVVRLKGGDPFVFGRGKEEVLACRRAGVDVTVVPGVSSALAAPAALGIPVSFRGLGRHVAIVTARNTGAADELDYVTLAAIDTLVVLMGRARLGDVCRGLIQAGKSPETPAASIQWATTPRQRSVVSRLDRLAGRVDEAGLRAPVVTIVGDVVTLADETAVGMAAAGFDFEQGRWTNVCSSPLQAD